MPLDQDSRSVVDPRDVARPSATESIVTTLHQTLTNRFGAITGHMLEVISAGGGVGVAAILDLTTLALVSRWLGPAAFGTYGVYLTLMTLIGGVSDLGLGVLLTKHFARRQESVSDEENLHLGLIFTIKVVIAGLLLTAGLIAYASHYADGWFHPTALLITLIGAAAVSLSICVTARLQGEHRFGANAAYSIGNSATKLVAMVALCLTGLLSPINALTAAVFAAVVSVCVGSFLVPWPPLRMVEKAKLRVFWATVRWVGAWSILGVILPRVDVLLVRTLADPTQTGHYLAATKLCAVLALANTAANVLLLPKLLRLRSAAALKRALRIWLFVIATAAIAILVPSEIFASQLVALVFGSAYQESAFLFRIVVIGSFLEFSLNPFAYAALAMNKPAAMTASHAARLALLLVFGIVMTRAFGATGMAVAVAASATLALGGLTIFVLTRPALGEQLSQTAVFEPDIL